MIGSIALAPVGEAIAGPLLEAIGTGPTLLWGAGMILVPTLLVFPRAPRCATSARPTRRAPRPTRIPSRAVLCCRANQEDAVKNLFTYEGKRCLIAGCYSGMGEATAQIVESLGGTVVAADIQKPTSFGYEAFHEIDLRDGGAIEQLVDTVAGGGAHRPALLLRGPAGTKPTLDVMLVNFVGLKHTIECAVPHMPRTGARGEHLVLRGDGLPREHGERDAARDRAPDGRGQGLGGGEPGDDRGLLLLEDVHHRLHPASRPRRSRRPRASGSTARAPDPRTRP